MKATGPGTRPTMPNAWQTWRKKCASCAGRTRFYGRPRLFHRGARPPTALIVAFIVQYRQEFGAWPICRTFTAAGTQIGPSISYDFKTRPPSKWAT